jgi:carboxypeptidase T
MNGPRRFGCALLLALQLLSAAPVAAQIPEPSSLWRVRFANPAAVQALADRFDVWEVHADQGWLLAYVTQSERKQLADEGFILELAPATSSTAAPQDFSCYHSITQQNAQLDAWAAGYPGLVHLSSIGSTFQGRPLQLATVTRFSNSSPKAHFFLIANIHGREIVTNEVALAFLDRLLHGAGSDPDISWLLDHVQIDVLMSANPDGHIQNEWVTSYWRKNLNPYQCASSYGVDLNRNWSYGWAGEGSSSDPCNELFRGSSADSESETQAVQAELWQLFAPAANPVLPAPDETTGIFITLHSYGNIISWPWGFTHNDAPNVVQLRRIGQRFAGLNAYNPSNTAIGYLSSGTTDDYAYSAFGIPSFTFEIGDDYYDGFYPACSAVPQLVSENMAPLLYAAKLAREPYRTAFGPTASRPEANWRPDGKLSVSSLLNNAVGSYFVDPVAGAEAWIDGSPNGESAATPLTAEDGDFGDSTEKVVGTLTPQGLSSGRHLILVRGSDSAGRWGAPSAQFITVTNAATLSAVTYRLGNPGASVALPITITNTGNTLSRFSITLEDNHWPASIGSSAPAQAPGAAWATTVSVTVPAGVAARTTDQVNLKVMSSSGELLASSQLTIEARGLVLTPSTVSLVARAGTSITTALSLRNLTDASEFQATLGGLQWPAFTSPTLLQVPPDGTIQLKIRFDVPGDITSGAVDTGTLRVDSPGEPMTSVTTTLTLHVASQVLWLPLLQRSLP